MKRILLIVVLICLFSLLIKPVHASFLYLSPDGSSVSKDSTFPVQVKLNTLSDVVNGVSAYLAFPKDKLEVASIQVDEQTLPITAEQDVDNNTIKISGANLGGISGDLAIATINFKAKALGQAQIVFIPGSAAPRTIDSSDSLNLDSSKGATFQINETGSTGPNPTSQPSGRRGNLCQEKETILKQRLASVLTSFLDTKAKIDTIYVLVDDYYTNRLQPQGISSQSYLDQRQKVEAKRILAVIQLEKLKADSQNFNCNLAKPQDMLRQIKKESESTRDAFKAYKEELRKLIAILIVL